MGRVGVLRLNQGGLGGRQLTLDIRAFVNLLLQQLIDMRQVGSIMQTDWLKVAGADGAAIIDAYKKK